MQWNDLIGAHVGPYRILEEIGRGGSGRVYKAVQEPRDRVVAMKVIVNDAEDALGFVKRFEREVELVARLNHPNIVAVYDSGQHQDLIYLVMRFVDGGTLRQRMGRPLPVGVTCGAMIAMCQALQHAHDAKIIHRDVKPSNMLVALDENGRLLLTDFGIAKLQGIRGMTKSGTTIGTPEYMAPEQAEGREVDRRADIYSLGCVLYEALTGQPPFVGTNAVSVLYQQVHSRPDYVRGLNPTIPRGLAWVVERALAKRPQERFDSAESLAFALMPFARDAGVSLAGIPTYQAVVVGGPTRIPVDGKPPRQAHVLNVVPSANVDAHDVHVISEAPTAPPRTVPSTTVVPSGLGSEGLDALFPEADAGETRAGRDVADTWTDVGARGSAAPPVITGGHSAPGPRVTLPLPAIRRLRTTARTLIDASVPEGRRHAPIGAVRDVRREQLRPAVSPRASSRRWLMAPVAAVGLVVVAAMVWMLAMAMGGGLSGHGSSSTLVHTATATQTQAPTATRGPQATATLTPQQTLDLEAKAAFRSITFATFTDSKCSSANNRTTFSANQSIYVNLCIAPSAGSGLLSIVLRQNGSAVRVVTRNAQVNPDFTWYSYYTYNVAPGSYDVLITFNGGTAADVNITVG